MQSKKELVHNFCKKHFETNSNISFEEIRRMSEKLNVKYKLARDYVKECKDMLVIEDDTVERKKDPDCAYRKVLAYVENFVSMKLEDIQKMSKELNIDYKLCKIYVVKFGKRDLGEKKVVQNNTNNYKSDIVKKYFDSVPKGTKFTTKQLNSVSDTIHCCYNSVAKYAKENGMFEYTQKKISPKTHNQGYCHDCGEKIQGNLYRCPECDESHTDNYFNRAITHKTGIQLRNGVMAKVMTEQEYIRPTVAW
jgi:signal recognition particle subunit SEC65